MKVLIADKEYDADYMVKTDKDVKAEAVIPSRARRKEPGEYDKDLHKE